METMQYPALVGSWSVWLAVLAAENTALRNAETEFIWKAQQTWIIIRFFGKHDFLLKGDSIFSYWVSSQNSVAVRQAAGQESDWIELLAYRGQSFIHLLIDLPPFYTNSTQKPEYSMSYPLVGISVGIGLRRSRHGNIEILLSDCQPNLSQPCRLGSHPSMLHAPCHIYNFLFWIFRYTLFRRLNILKLFFPQLW